jgi:DNA-binding transcriptional ArsR family regulator
MPSSTFTHNSRARGEELAHEHSLGLLELVAQGERSASLSLANASQHLQRLRRAGLVVGRRKGRFVVGRLTDEAVLGVMARRRVKERKVGRGTLTQVPA